MNIIAIDDEKLLLKSTLLAIADVFPNDNIKGFGDVGLLLEYAEQNKIDLAFLDINLGAFSGEGISRLLKKTNPEMKIIFATGYEGVIVEKFTLNPTGFLTKPVATEDIVDEMKKIEASTRPLSQKRIVASTFGSFKLYADGLNVEFNNEDSKELLAYLIDKNGEAISKKDIIATLYNDVKESRASKKRLKEALKSLLDVLAKIQADNLIKKTLSTLAVDNTLYGCDLYDYFYGNPQAINLFKGEYLNDYTWAYDRLDSFYQEKLDE